jgi:hypothetical protein
MSRNLAAPNGAVLIGTPASAEVFAAVTPAQVANGATARSIPCQVPAGSFYVSFEVQATPSGPCALAIVIRTANRITNVDGEILSSGGNTSSVTAFDSFSTATSEVYVIEADANFVQIEVTPTGADCAVVVTGASR